MSSLRAIVDDKFIINQLDTRIVLLEFAARNARLEVQTFEVVSPKKLLMKSVASFIHLKRLFLLDKTVKNARV